MNLGAMIKEGNQASMQDRAKTLFSFVIISMKVKKKKIELLMRNHQFRPTGFEPFPKMNAISSQTRRRG